MISLENEAVNCGQHTATKCEYCPQGNGKFWCNGQCQWDSSIYKCVDYSMKKYSVSHC